MKLKYASYVKHEINTRKNPKKTEKSTGPKYDWLVVLSVNQSGSILYCQCHMLYTSYFINKMIRHLVSWSSQIQLNCHRHRYNQFWDKQWWNKCPHELICVPIIEEKCLTIFSQAAALHIVNSKPSHNFFSPIDAGNQCCNWVGDFNVVSVDGRGLGSLLRAGVLGNLASSASVTHLIISRC